MKKKKTKRKIPEYHWEYCARCKRGYLFFKAYTRRTKIHEVAIRNDWLVLDNGKIVCPTCLSAEERKNQEVTR